MTLSNSVYLQMMQSVNEKTIKREFEVKEEDVVNDDAFIGGTYHLGGNGLKEKVLKGISDEEVYKLQFDCIDEAETFYNIEGQRATKFIENEKRQREPRSLSRVGCEAAFRVGLNRKDGKWIVKEFIGDHNHNLVDAINTQFQIRHKLMFCVKTDAYKKPLVVLVDVNHHHQTVVFGCALLIDESVGTYEWVLETFLDAMMNKKPISIVTDRDKAMRKAIKKVLLDTCHRLCSWHLQRNAFTNVHIKDFSSIFARCMFMRGNEEEFEKVEHLEEIPQSCIMKRWTKLAKVYTRSVPVNETDNDMDRFVRYGSLSSMCNKLSYFASDTSSSFIEAKNEIQNLTARMEELYTYNLKGKKIAVDGVTGTNQVRDPNIVKTKGNPGKVAMNVQKERRCSHCKRVGHTIRKCQKLQSLKMLSRIAGFQQHEQNMTTPCQATGEKYPQPVEKIPQPVDKIPQPVATGYKNRQPVEKIPQPVATSGRPVALG
ncbi:Protein FAR1-related sequence 5 [Vitis vinifera]|uniref:Protein FAR1-related sequence 5 n=1 Tax=Vitis vinifera TaxID=29760 RepID=A0A438IKA6_VITVI|nr:Protein FAR1-related sequence 5 [Vitis vinifera]